jgi:hypothetical protein
MDPRLLVYFVCTRAVQRSRPYDPSSGARCGAHLVSCGIWQVDSSLWPWPQIVLFHQCSLAVAPASSTCQVLLQLPSLLLTPCAMLLPCKVDARPSQYCATETSEVVRHLATWLFLCSRFMICVAMVLRCAERHGGAQQIGIIVRGVWWCGSICLVCFGHDGFSTDGAFTGLEDSSNISAAIIIIVRTWWRKLRPGSVDQICN